MYSKGMILASAIKQVRGLGDNKFEVVTSLRTFVFRAEREGRLSRLRFYPLRLLHFFLPPTSLHSSTIISFSLLWRFALSLVCFSFEMALLPHRIRLYLPPLWFILIVNSARLCTVDFVENEGFGNCVSWRRIFWGLAFCPAVLLSSVCFGRCISVHTSCICFVPLTKMKSTNWIIISVSKMDPHRQLCLFFLA